MNLSFRDLRVPVQGLSRFSVAHSEWRLQMAMPVHHRIATAGSTSIWPPASVPPIGCPCKSPRTVWSQNERLRLQLRSLPVVASWVRFLSALFWLTTEKPGLAGDSPAYRGEQVNGHSKDGCETSSRWCPSRPIFFLQDPLILSVWCSLCVSAECQTNPNSP